MPYHGYDGQEIEDSELDNMRRERGRAMRSEVDPHAERLARVESVLSTLDAAASLIDQQVATLEARVAQLELDLGDLDGRLQNRGVVLANRIDAVEAQVETVSESLVRHQDKGGGR